MAYQLDETDIAIVGMAGRFPGARNIDEFWRNLRGGVEAISFFSDQEMESSGVAAAIFRDPNYVKAAAVIDEPYGFDAAFFGYTPREAELMDPQHRVLLECAWEALEHAGYDGSTYKGAIGVFAGATINTYLLVNIVSNPGITEQLEDVQINVANGGDFLTTRISYKLNLRGPSHLVQSACSTSLVAIHLGCQSLLNDESDMALAGGVSINDKLKHGYRYVEGGMVSPDGHCRAFDAKAQGTIFGSGVGMVVLKRIEDALADGDTIHAIIKGSAINNDGSLKVGYTAPSVDGQAEVITEAMANAGVRPDTITCIEAHGTGTPLGDPIEIQALTKAFSAGTTRKGFCALGSVKTNIGHLDAAAGVTGLIKTVLALKHGEIPPSLHFEQANPQIDFQSSPFYVNTSLKRWEADGSPRRAGVSAFGVGGTNAHIVLEEAPQAKASGPSRPLQLITLSAKTAAALDKASANLADYIDRHPDVNLADLSYTLKVGRQAFNHRRMVVCRDAAEAKAALEATDHERVFTDYAKAAPRAVAFLFPGQGSQRVNMGLELYRQERAFRDEVDACARLLRPHLGIDIRDALYPASGGEARAAEQLNQTAITQPALFVIEYALAKMWIGWGVRPIAMIGHSIGEYVAACLAGVMTLDEALKLVAQRGRLMQSLPTGAMISVGISREEVEPLLTPGLSIAAVNGPTQCVVSGAAGAIEQMERRLEGEGIFYRRLKTSHAFHSEMMEPILDQFKQQVSAITLKAPSIPYVSNVTGTWIKDTEATSAHYWAEHLRRTVLFSDGVGELMKEQSWALLEVGAGETLTRLLKRRPASSGRIILASLPREDETRSDLECALTTLGKLWLSGAEIEWLAFYLDEKRSRVALPTYPFERQRFWIEPKAQAPALKQAQSGKRADLSEWFYMPSWKKTPPAQIAAAQSASDESSEAVWVVFADRYEIADCLIERLKAEGKQVIRVEAGESYERVSDSLYRVAVNERASYEQVMREAAAVGKGELKVVHLWSVDEQQEGEGRSYFDRAQLTGFQSLLFLAQSLDRLEITRPVHINVVSNRTQSITPAEELAPEKATLLGACKVIPQEYPHIVCRSFDVIVPHSKGWQTESLVARLIAEFKAELPDRVVAIRGDQRWVQAYEPVRLEASDHPIRPLKQGGVYMITGGLSGIGFALAQYLAASFQARLALLHDLILPERERRAAYLASHDNRTETSRAIAKISALEEAGAQVIDLGADLSDARQVRAAVDRAIAQFGRLDGVIHAAGAPVQDSFRTVAELGRAECDKHFEPKVYALYALEEALSGLSLDFCVIDSSLSSVLGGLGYMAYASANQFVDSFVANHNKNHPVAWTSINWDAWNLSGEKEQLANISADLAQLAMKADEGIEAFRRILSSSASDQIIVSTGDLEARIDHYIKAAPSLSLARPEAGDESASLHPRPKLATAYVAPTTRLEQAIVSTWEKSLGIRQIGIQDNFFDLGGDSLLAVQVIARLRKELGMDIPVVSLYEGVTVKSLADLLTSVEQEQEADSGNNNHDDREQRALRRKQYQQKQRSRKRDATV